MAILVYFWRGRERFEEESLAEMRKRQVIDQSAPSGSSCQTDGMTIYDIAPRLRAFSDWLLKVTVLGNMDSIFPAASHEYSPFVEELWKDAAIQATYNRRDELQMLPRSASYFLEKARLEVTNCWPAGSSLRALLLILPSAEKPSFLYSPKWTYWGKSSDRFLFSQCDWLSEFNPVVSHNGANNASFNTSLAQRAAHYVGSKFKQLFHMPTGRKLYVSVVNGLALDNVDAELKYAREILKWHDEKPNFTPNEWSSYSLDGSTSS